MPVKRPLENPLLTPRVANGGKTPKRRLLTKHDSVIEQYVASHPIRAQDLIYPTNIMVKDVVIGDQTAASYDITPELTLTGRATPSSIAVVTPDKDRIQLILDTLPAQRITMLVTIAVFSGYAALFSLQHVIKVFYGIPDDGSEASHQFSFAITIQYICNLIFRLGHNAILMPFTPRQRCLVGLVAMGIAMSILSIGIFTLNHKSLPLLATAYGFGGCAVGVFETNYSVVLAALGTQTKIYGISGIPLGIFLVIVPGFIAVGMGMDVRFIYLSVVVLLLLGIFVLFNVIHYPQVDSLLSWNEFDDTEEEEETIVEPRSRGSKKSFISWILPVVSVGLVFLINMMFVSAFSPGVLLYILNGPEVSILPSFPIRTGYFFAIFSSCGFIGDVLSRRLVYKRASANPFHPIWYLTFTACGVLIILTQMPLIAPIGTFLVFFGNGSIYAQSCRKLDTFLDSSVSLWGNSLFFFLGDCGSVVGAVSIPFVRDLMTM
jgi:hypothetical protein